MARGLQGAVIRVDSGSLPVTTNESSRYRMVISLGTNKYRYIQLYSLYIEQAPQTVMGAHRVNCKQSPLCSQESETNPDGVPQ